MSRRVRAKSRIERSRRVSALRTIVDDAVGAAIDEHPKYFTPKGVEKARAAIVRKIMAAFRDDGEKSEPAAEPDKAKPFEIALPNSREAAGYLNLRTLAGAVAPQPMGDGGIVVVAAAWCEAVFVLSDLPPRSEWIFLYDRRPMGAWFDFFKEKLPNVARRVITEVRNGETGILMPYPFPPSKEGKLYLASDEAGAS